MDANLGHEESSDDQNDHADERQGAVAHLEQQTTAENAGDCPTQRHRHQADARLGGAGAQDTLDKQRHIRNTAKHGPTRQDAVQIGDVKITFPEKDAAG